MVAQDRVLTLEGCATPPQGPLGCATPPQLGHILGGGDSSDTKRSNDATMPRFKRQLKENQASIIPQPSMCFQGQTKVIKN
jgi:hypothetical protein